MTTSPDAYRSVRRLDAAPDATELDRVLAYLAASPAEPLLLNLAGVHAHGVGRADDAAALLERAYSLDAELPAAEENFLTALLAAEGGPLDPRVAEIVARARPASGLTLSLCMIARDEEDAIEGSLASALPYVDEAIVVDTGSTDRTPELAAAAGARVVETAWGDSFAEARNRSMDEARGDWVLYLDADERLENGAALRSRLGRVWREGFVLEVENLTGPSTGTRHSSLRLFRNRPAHRFVGRLHERLGPVFPYDLPERIERGPARILHDGYRPERVRTREKAQRNLRLLALEARESPGAYTSFNFGSEYLRLGRWAEAVEHLREAWEAVRRRDDWTGVPWAPVLALRLGRAQRELARVGAARAVLLAALERAPDYTDLVFELACCELASGAPERAAGYLERCRELGDAGPDRLATIGAGGVLAEGLLAELKRATCLPIMGTDYHSLGGRHVEWDTAGRTG